jgi:UDP-N-acetylmuramate dehydrogenase
MARLLDVLPDVRGKYREHADLSKVTWFRVGGAAEVLFRPADVNDLSHFLHNKPTNVAVMVLGLCSNVLVRDGGIDGVVIRLGGGFNEVIFEGGRVTVGAGCLNSQLTDLCIGSGVGGLEFLSGIPGSIGGALAMNAGAYGVEISDVLIEAHALDMQGKAHVFSNMDMGFSYRQNALPEEYIFTKAVFAVTSEQSDVVAARVADIAQKRESTQPIKTRTGGSTFRNPVGDKSAWQLVDAVGGRGLTIGGAQVSEKHCNFLMNIGEATAADIEDLGEELRARVLRQHGVDLYWEIKRLGNASFDNAD